MVLKKIVNRFKNKLYGTGFVAQNLNSQLASPRVRKYYKEHLKFSPKVKSILKRAHPRYDALILKRSPQLIFEKTPDGEKLVISEIYDGIEEIRTDKKPYEAFTRILNRTIFQSAEIYPVRFIGSKRSFGFDPVHQAESNLPFGW
jgi:hypothetical protein